MSYNTELQSNNVDLQAILDTVSALPEAGGSDNDSIKTCTVTFNITNTSPWAYLYIGSNVEVDLVVS